MGRGRNSPFSDPSHILEKVVGVGAKVVDVSTTVGGILGGGNIAETLVIADKVLSATECVLAAQEQKILSLSSVFGMN